MNDSKINDKLTLQALQVSYNRAIVERDDARCERDFWQQQTLDAQKQVSELMSQILGPIAKN